mmetsp:Transcript_5672/g.13080  ORF Transcript_5672/g.13080 Transcript_5672/m.13080 type:complete len:120 (-) Transcript_5672:158-517(-)
MILTSSLSPAICPEIYQVSYTCQSANSDHRLENVECTDLGNRQNRPHPCASDLPELYNLSIREAVARCAGSLDLRGSQFCRRSFHCHKKGSTDLFLICPSKIVVHYVPEQKEELRSDAV